jgi:hypothetical protein
LKENGRIVFDVYYITLKELSAPEGSLIVPPHPPFEMPDVRKVSWGIMRRGVIDYNQQTMQDGLFYDIEYPDGRKERLVYTDPLRYYYPFEVEHLLARCGFQTEATYADFKKTPFGSQYPSELIFVARKV